MKSLWFEWSEAGLVAVAEPPSTTRTEYGFVVTTHGPFRTGTVLGQPIAVSEEAT